MYKHQMKLGRVHIATDDCAFVCICWHMTRECVCVCSWWCILGRIIDCVCKLRSQNSALLLSVWTVPIVSSSDNRLCPSLVCACYEVVYINVNMTWKWTTHSCGIIMHVKKKSIKNCKFDFFSCASLISLMLNHLIYKNTFIYKHIFWISSFTLKYVRL